MITVLCVQEKSNYYKIPGLNLYDRERDAWSYTGRDMVIAHPPCQQWSRLRSFAKDNPSEKHLAYHCWDIVNENGGIFEHPMGSSFFRAVNADFSKIISVNQWWWGFPGRKTTYLYFHNCKPLSYPLNFNAVRPNACTQYMNSQTRSKMTSEFCQYLVNCITESQTPLRGASPPSE